MQIVQTAHSRLAQHEDSALSQHYTSALRSLCTIGRTYLAAGRTRDAQQVLEFALPLLDGVEVKAQDQLKLLLTLAKVLVVNQLVMRADIGRTLTILAQTQQIADATHDQWGLADGLSLLGQAHYFALVLNSNTLDHAEGDFAQVRAYHEQALALREALHDTRGISESHFCLGNVYEREQQPARARRAYMTARQIAEEHGHPYEKTEPSRHLALLALMAGDTASALTDATQALALRAAAGFMPYLPLDHALLSTVYLAIGDTDNALVHAQQAINLAEQIGYTSALVLAQLSLGDVQLAQHKPTEARVSYEQAVLQAQTLGFPLLLARATASLTRLSTLVR